MRLYLFTWKHWQESKPGLAAEIEAEPGPAVEAEPGPAVEAEPGPAVEAEPGPAVEAEPAAVVETEPGADRASGLARQVAAQPAPERRAFADPEAVHQLQQSDSSEESFGFPARSTALFDP